MSTKSAAGFALGLTIVLSAHSADAQHAGHGTGRPQQREGTAMAGAPSRKAEGDSAGLTASDRKPVDAVTRSMPHQMWMQPLGRGWHVMGMAQVFPTVTAGTPWREETLLNTAGLYATQPAAMFNLTSPNARVVLRTTLNFEAWTQRDGELTFGGWGEGFIDSRHPHTVLHEAMLTANWWNVAGGALSISAGKGFAPYGTDDPMSRPAVKFPTNHHLSQVLERWTMNGAYLKGGWSLEAGLFGGGEPTGPYDFSNVESFGDSWSARVAKRFGVDLGPSAEWEVSASYANIEEEHHSESVMTRLYNASVRHAQPHAFGTLYALLEGSKSNPESAKGYYSILGEASLSAGRESRHQPYLRVEYATRPEFARLGPPGTPEFFRYDHDAHHEIGATRWLITTIGYGYESSGLPVSVRPYVELQQQNRVRAERGDIDPRDLFGSRDFWGLSAGARIYLGGGPMRMGSYGALDPMTTAMRPRASEPTSSHHGHSGP
jgi:hypothetical protein